MSDNLIDLFRSRAPDLSKTLIETTDGRTISYGETYERAGQFIAVLRNLGVRPDDRVMVKLDKSPDALILYLAVLAMGAVYVPLNVDYTLAELDYFIGDAAPKVLVCRPAEAGDVSKLTGRHGVTSCLALGTDRHRLARRHGECGRERLRGRSARRGRSRRDPLHIRDHGTFQGRDADPRQSRLERPRPRRSPGALPTRTFSSTPCRSSIPTGFSSAPM